LGGAAASPPRPPGSYAYGKERQLALSNGVATEKPRLGAIVAIFAIGVLLTRKGDKERERKKSLILAGKKIEWNENENIYLLW